MTRKDEISIIQSLKGDTYFAKLFGDATIDAMCQNINNDFPIECGIQIFQESDVAKENVALKSRLARMMEADEKAATEILRKAGDLFNEALEDVAERLIGRKKCLVIKLKEGMPITEYDREELLGYLEN